MTAPRPPRGTFRINARGWIFLLLTGSVGLAAAAKGNNLLFALFAVLLGILLVCGFLTVAVARRVEIARLLPDAVFADEPFSIILRVRNAKRLWPVFCLRLEDRLTHQGRPASEAPGPVWIPLARPRERVRATAYAVAHERGWAALGPMTVVSEFTPGLFTWRAQVPVHDPLLVLPRRAVITRRVLNPFLSRVEAEMSAVTCARGDEEFAGLREFRPGDPPRRIHWKSAGRVPGRLLVREYENPQVRDATILLDTYVPVAGDPRRGRRMERAISFAAALAQTLFSEHYTVRLRAFGPDPVDLALTSRLGALDELRAALAILQPSRVRTLADLVSQEEGAVDRVYFVLRIGRDPIPACDALPRSMVIDTLDMKALMEVEE